MKLLVISAAFPPLKAGEADHAFHLCHRLVKRGLNVHVLTTKNETVTPDLPFKVHAIMPHWTWSDLPRLASFLRRCSPDAVLLIYSDQDYNSHPMITFAPSISKALIPSSRFVTQFETEYVLRRASLLTRALLKTTARVAGPKTLDYVFGTLLAGSDRVITLSQRHLAGLSARFDNLERKSVVVPPPALLQICSENSGAMRRRGREKLGVKPDDFLIAYYGYIYAEKGIETLFKAFQILKHQRNNVRLVMIGGNSGRDDSSHYVSTLREFGGRLGIQNDIIWTGEYGSDSDEGSIYLRAADAGVFPFKYGVTLNRSSIATAATHGLPIVTTKGESLESAFIDRENVLLTPPEDPKSLALAVCSLVDNDAQRQRLQEGALKLAAEYFSWDKAVGRTIEALME